MSRYLSGRVPSLNIGISSITDDSTVLIVTGAIGINTDDAGGRRLYAVNDAEIVGVTTLASAGGITTTGGNLFVGKDLYVQQNFVIAGLTTFQGNVDIDQSLNVDGNVNVVGLSTFNDNVDINNSLNVDQNVTVTGLSTFNNNVDINNSLNVDQNVTVTGLSTFTNTIDANGGATIDNVRIGITDTNEIDTSTGNLVIDSAGGTVTVDDQFIVTGISTFNSNVDIDKSLNVDQNVTVTGLSTFNSNVDIDKSLNVDQNVNVTGFSTFNNNVDINNSLNVDQNVNVTGFSTFNNNVDINNSLNVDNNVTVTGLSTFTGLLDANGGATIDNVRIGIADNNEIDTSVGNLVIDSAGGTVTVDDQLIVTGISTFNDNVDIDKSLNVDSNLSVTGLSTFVGIVTNQSTIFGTQLSVSGVSTFVNLVDANGGAEIDNVRIGIADNNEIDTSVGNLVIDSAGGTVTIDDQFIVTGISTFNDNVDIDKSLNVDQNVTVTGLSTFNNNVDINNSLNVDSNVTVTGLSTFTGSIDANGDLDVDGHTELDQLNVSGVSTFVGIVTNQSTIFGTQLSVSGVSTFLGNIDANGDIDIDGHAELDQLNVSGVSTFVGIVTNQSTIFGTQLSVSGVSTFLGNIDANGDIDVDGHAELDQLNVSGVSTFVGNVSFSNDIDVDGHTELDQLNVSGVSTFAGNIDANGDIDVDGHTELDQLNVSGVSTFVGNVSFSNDIDVDGHSELDQLNVSGVSTFVGNVSFSNDIDVDGHAELDQLSVSGVSTFTGNIDANGDIDVDGHAELDQLNVSGVSTFVGNVAFTNNIDVDGHAELDQLNVSGVSTFVGIVTNQSTIFGTQLSVSGVSTFLGNIDANGDIDVDGHAELDQLNVSGVSTFVGNVDFVNNIDVDGHTELDQLNVSGVSTFVGDVVFTNNIDVDGHAELDQLNVSGVSTFAGNIDANGDIDIDGHAELDQLNVSGVSTFVGVGTFVGDLYVGGDLYVKDDVVFDQINASSLVVSGVSTFTGLIDSNGGLDVTGGTNTDNLNVTGISTIETLSVLTNFDVYDSTATFHNDVFIGGNLSIGGTTTVITASDLRVLDADIILGVTTDAFGNDVSTDITANHGGIAVASTEGSPLVQLYNPGIGETSPATYKKIMWFREGSFAGLGTDAWLINYAVGIGSTQFASGVRLAVTNTQITDTTIFTPNISIGQNLTVGGISTFTNNIDANGDLDVDGHTELDQLRVSGVSTFIGNVAFNSDIDVDGHAELDQLNVSGVSTFAGSIDANGDLDVDGHTELDQLNVSGVSTFVGNVSLTNNIDVDGHTELDQLNVSGVSTFVGNVSFTNNIDVDGHAELDQLNVSGVSTFTGNIDANGDIDIDGHAELDQLNVSGVSTFVGNVSFTNNIDVDGHAELDQLNVSGVSTFVDNTSFNNDIDVDGHAELDQLNVSGVSTFVGNVAFTNNIDVDGHAELDQLNVSGVSTFVGIVTNQSTIFGTQLSVSGVSTLTGNVTFGSNAFFGDSDTLNFGDSNDLQIKHDGANSLIRDVGTGSLVLQSDGVGVDIYNNVNGEYHARFKNNDAVELYHNNILRLETTGYGVTVYDTIQAPQLNITGIGTIDGVTIASGIVTSSQPGVTTVKYYGDGSNLFGVNAFNVINQDLATSPVYPTFANNIGVTSIGIANTEMGYVPSSGNLGIGSTNPTAKLQVVGNVLISGITTASQFVGNVNVGVATIGLATITSGFVDSLTVGIATVNKLDVNQISPDGVDYGSFGYFPKADGSGGWSWADVPGLFSVNNILNGFNVSDEGLIVGTAGSITQLDFRGSNIIASADPQPNGIATIRVSDTPDFNTLNVSGISTFAGITTVSGPTLFTQQLSVAGVSTFTGIATFVSDLYVGGDLYVADDLIFDSFTARQITVTESSSLGIASATTLNVTGLTTTTLLNVGVGGTIITTTNDPRVGINSISPNFTLDVNGDVNFNGTLYQNNSPFIASRWSAGIGDDIYRLNGDVGIGTTNPQYKLEVSGDARISGITSVTNLEIYGTVSAGTTTGTSGQYLRSTGIGVTWSDFPTLRTTGISTATEGQTTFSFSYNVGFIDVFVNGVKLTGSEFTAINGSSVILASPAFSDDIVEFIGYNTVSTSGGGGGGASSLNDLTDVTLTSPAAGEALIYNGTQWINDYTVTASTSSTSQTAIHTLSSSTYRSVEYTIQATQGLKYHLTKLLVVHDGTDAFFTEYGTVFTIDSLGTFDFDISSGNLRLLVTPSAVTTTDYKIKFTAFKL